MVRRNKRNNEDIKSDSWLNTYADMVTLILTFFIMLYTMSSVDAEKWKILMEAFENNKDTQQVVLVPEGIGEDMGSNHGEGAIIEGDILATDPQLPENFDELYRYIQTYIRENDLESSVEIHKGENSVFIRFRDNIFFDPDKANLKINSKNLLDFMGDCFNSLNDQILAIRINGHTATVPGAVKTPGFDRTLSTDRANSVLIYLEEDAKVEAKKLIAIGYGRNYPIATNNSEEGHVKNRRVEMLILSNEVNAGGEDDIYNLLQGDFGIDMIDSIVDHENNSEILIPN